MPNSGPFRAIMPRPRGDCAPWVASFRTAAFCPVLVVLVVGIVALPGCSASRAARNHTTDSASGLAEQALEAEERGDLRRATHLMGSAVEINPTDCETRLQLSELLLKHGNLDEASAHLEELAERNPDDPRIAFRLAQTWFLMGQVEKSAHWLAVGLELDPDNEQGLLLAGRLAEWRADSSAAIATYVRVLDVAPESNAARLRLAVLLNAAGQPNRAAPHARRVLDSEQSCPAEVAEAQWQLGESYVLLGRVEEGESLLTAASKLRPLTTDQWHELALAQARVGRRDEALASIARVLAASPGNSDAVQLQQWLLAPSPAVASRPEAVAGHQVGAGHLTGHSNGQPSSDNRASNPSSSVVPTVHAGARPAQP